MDSHINQAQVLAYILDSMPPSTFVSHLQTALDPAMGYTRAEIAHFLEALRGMGFGKSIKRAKGMVEQRYSEVEERLSDKDESARGCTEASSNVIVPGDSSCAVGHNPAYASKATQTIPTSLPTSIDTTPDPDPPSCSRCSLTPCRLRDGLGSESTSNPLSCTIPRPLQCDTAVTTSVNPMTLSEFGPLPRTPTDIPAHSSDNELASSSGSVATSILVSLPSTPGSSIPNTPFYTPPFSFDGHGAPFSCGTGTRSPSPSSSTALSSASLTSSPGDSTSFESNLTLALSLALGDGTAFKATPPAMEVHFITDLAPTPSSTTNPQQTKDDYLHLSALTTASSGASESSPRTEGNASMAPIPTKTIKGPSAVPSGFPRSSLSSPPSAEHVQPKHAPRDTTTQPPTITSHFSIAEPAVPSEPPSPTPKPSTVVLSKNSPKSEADAPPAHIALVASTPVLHSPSPAPNEKPSLPLAQALGSSTKQEATATHMVPQKGQTTASLPWTSVCGVPIASADGYWWR